MAFCKRITEINLYNSLENEVLRWQSVATIFFDWRPPVLAFLTIFIQIWLYSKIVRGITLQNVHENCKQKKIFQNFFLILRFFSIFKWRERKISYRSLPASYFHWNKYLFGKFHSHSGQELHKSRNIRIDSQYFRHIFNMRLLAVADLLKEILKNHLNLWKIS